MSAQQIVVLGGGFAGLWSAVGAARKLDELGRTDEVQVTLVNRDAYHNIRVRNYEVDLAPARVPLDEVLGPIGVRRVEAEVESLDLAAHAVRVRSARGTQSIHYDRLVFALGSELVRPNLPGLGEFAFDVDTYRGAARLNAHLQTLSRQPPSPGRWTVVVVGAGLTGIETAAEMPTKLRAAAAHAPIDAPLRVILADHNSVVGSDMGPSARPVIEEALASLGIETRLGVRIARVDRHRLTLESGEEIPAATTVWCAGMRASSLTAQLPVERDCWGRLAVDEFLRVPGVPGVFAAGDSAWLMVDETHPSVMSCQHGRPMGRFAGHNVVCDLFGLPMLPLRIDWYVTVLDLGPWGALYTEGWQRRVAAIGLDAKRTKQIINGQRIYPPLGGDRAAILAAATPVVQSPPEKYAPT